MSPNTWVVSKNRFNASTQENRGVQATGTGEGLHRHDKDCAHRANRGKGRTKHELGTPRGCGAKPRTQRPGQSRRQD